MVIGIGRFGDPALLTHSDSLFSSETLFFYYFRGYYRRCERICCSSIRFCPLMNSILLDIGWDLEWTFLKLQLMSYKAMSKLQQVLYIPYWKWKSSSLGSHSGYDFFLRVYLPGSGLIGAGIVHVRSRCLPPQPPMLVSEQLIGSRAGCLSREILWIQLHPRSPGFPARWLPPSCSSPCCTLPSQER